MKTDYLLNKEFKPDISNFTNAVDAMADVKALAKNVSSTAESVKKSGIPPAAEPTVSGADGIDQKYQKAKTAVTQLIQEYGKECAMANTLTEQITGLQKNLEETVKAERKRMAITLLVVAVVIIVLFFLISANM